VGSHRSRVHISHGYLHQLNVYAPPRVFPTEQTNIQPTEAWNGLDAGVGFECAMSWVSGIVTIYYMIAGSVRYLTLT